MTQNIRLLTYNIRKGKGPHGWSGGSVHALGQALESQHPDLLLCQEVFHPRRRGSSQSDELATHLDLRPYYRPNKRRRIGHHGNATFTRLPVEHWENFDLSVNRLERRGMLYLRLGVDGRPLHVFNVHLSLSHGQRLAQVRRIAGLLAARVGPDEPVILAGDFNDWQRRLDTIIVRDMGLTNAFAHLRPAESLTWHVRRPLFNLDRIYVRHLQCTSACRLAERQWRDLSDHFPLAVDVRVA